MKNGPWLISFSIGCVRGWGDRGWRSAVRLLAVSAALGLSVETAAAAPQAPANSLGLTYEVYAGGLHVFTFDVDLVLEPNGYRIAAQGGTRGMTSMFYAWDVKLAAEGETRSLSVKTPVALRMRPERYVTVNIGGQRPKTMQLVFDAAGSFSIMRDPLEPHDEADEPQELPASLPNDILDPLSAALVAAQKLANTGRCEQTIPVFDGKRRYNLLMHDAGFGAVPKSRLSVYDGPATLCSLTMERISGFSKKKRRYASQWNEDKDEPPTLWIARVRDDLPPVPVRFTGAVSLGSIIVHLTKIKPGTEIAATAAR